MGIPEQVIEWVVGQPPDRSVVETVGLREGSNPWLLRFGDGTSAVLRVGDPRDLEERDRFGIEARALELAAAYDLLTSRLIACDLTGERAGTHALLSTVVAGSSRIPHEPTPVRLQEYGAATAALHRVPGSAARPMPRRVRPIQPIDFAAVRRERGASSLLRQAEAAVAGVAVPEREPVFVHGDLWQGNTLWVDSTLTGFVDWDCAGVGEAGLDVASIRLDAALMFGVEYADPVLAGYLGASRREAVADLAFWDVVAALSTPPRMAEFAPVIQDQGRPDLDQPTLERRRDTFLRAALERLA
jgi:aminoglycoside phosphotransferase (APT) family kinase protein